MIRQRGDAGATTKICSDRNRISSAGFGESTGCALGEVDVARRKCVTVGANPRRAGGGVGTECSYCGRSAMSRAPKRGEDANARPDRDARLRSAGEAVGTAQSRRVGGLRREGRRKTMARSGQRFAFVRRGGGGACRGEGKSRENGGKCGEDEFDLAVVVGKRRHRGTPRVLETLYASPNCRP